MLLVVISVVKHILNQIKVIFVMASEVRYILYESKNHFYDEKGIPVIYKYFHLIYT